MSFKPEVKTHNDDKWYGNALVFATQEEALFSAKDLYHRWALCTDYRAVESNDPVNYRIDMNTRELMAVPEIVGVPV